jgi:glycosyltransferase involved in cell wall biosynthesis
LGRDIFDRVREEIPLDIVGMGSKEVGGLGEIPITELPEFVSRYRFFFNPIRYTSLGLAVCEAMMIGMPVVGLATTEMSVMIKNGESGFVSTNVDFLIESMKELLQNKPLAEKLGKGAKQAAEERFNIVRFSQDWINTFEEVLERSGKIGSGNKIRLGGLG